VSLSAGRWASDITVDSVTWRLDGAQVATGTSFRLPDNAGGKRLTAVVGAHRVVKGLANGVRSVPDTGLTSFEFPFDVTIAGGTVIAKPDPPKQNQNTDPPEQPGVPSIVGAARVGVTLTVSSTPWPQGTALSYQWLADGQPIPGATAQTLALTAGLRGKVITVQVTGVKGTQTWTQVSAPIAKVAVGKIAKHPAPKISGKAKVGAKLKVKAGKWDKGVKKAYRWYVGSKRIKGAKSATLKVKAGWVGKTIRVKVVGSKAGYKSVTKTSKRTAKIRR
jgi:hypothetical protein